MEPNGIYLMDDGRSLKLYISRDADEQNLTDLFGHSNIFDQGTELVEDMIHFDDGNAMLVKFHALLKELRAQKTICYPYLHIIVEGSDSAQEHEFYGKLIEDKNEQQNMAGYKMAYDEFYFSLFK